jgi:hypothetical protein
MVNLTVSGMLPWKRTPGWGLQVSGLSKSTSAVSNPGHRSALLTRPAVTGRDRVDHLVEHRSFVAQNHGAKAAYLPPVFLQTVVGV